MIAFGSSISGGEAYRRYAEPGVRRASEADSVNFAYAAVEPVGRTYNLILDAAARCDDLEALVLVHPHTEIIDSGFCAKVRAALAPEDVGMVGWAGATDVRGLAWWEGHVTCAAAIHRYEEHGGGDIPALSWIRRGTPPAEVDCLDGQLLVLSPWAVRTLRFDEGLLFGHGFDLDFSLQVRAAGRRLMVADLQVSHHRSLELVA
ncbi:MAG: glycosyltransferase, partial [Solirubrobacteraceae bacterium]